MGRSGWWLLGAAVGAAAAFAVNYFFGPTAATTYDENYRSRLDYALDEGRRAAATRERELRGELQTLRLPAANLPPAPAPAPPPGPPPAPPA
jgi:hypothetical protein